MTITDAMTIRRRPGPIRKPIALSLAIALLAATGLSATTVRPAAAQAQAESPSSALDPAGEALSRLFAEPAAEPPLSEAFLREVPAAEVRRIVEDLVASHGDLVGVESRGGGRYTVRLERAAVPARIALDGAGRIAGLFLEPPVVAATIEEAVAALADLPGATAALVTTDGAERAAHEPDRPLAVGSAMKLAILDALARKIAAGEADWADVVAFEDHHRSLPTGRLQDWPAGTPITLAVAAGLMISESDNSATDLLLDVVGREAAARIVPRNTPFLSTGEAFRLKARDAADLRARWIDAEPGERLEILGALPERPLPRADEIEPEPTVGVEWFFSVRELCDLMERVANLPAMAIASGPVDRDAFATVAYKGGEEAGVLNLTAEVMGRDGRRHCVALTWNDIAPLEDARLVSAFRSILAGLAGEGG